MKIKFDFSTIIRQGVVCLAGLLAIIFALTMFGASNGSYESNESYGGDAYTGIQNAAAQGANNVRYTTDAVAGGFGKLLFVVGLAMIGTAVGNVITFVPAEKKEPVAPAYNTAPSASAAPHYCGNCGTPCASGEKCPVCGFEETPSNTNFQ